MSWLLPTYPQSRNSVWYLVDAGSFFVEQIKEPQQNVSRWFMLRYTCLARIKAALALLYSWVWGCLSLRCLEGVYVSHQTVLFRVPPAGQQPRCSWEPVGTQTQTPGPLNPSCLLKVPGLTRALKFERPGSEAWSIPCPLPTLLSSYTQPPPPSGCHGPPQEAAPVPPKLFT